MRATPITSTPWRNEHPCRAKAPQEEKSLKQFLEAYRHEALPLTNDHLDQARSVLDGWQKDTGLDAGQTDYGRAARPSTGTRTGPVRGITYAEGEPAGFVLGERSMTRPTS